jgi:hypothetical protein
MVRASKGPCIEEKLQAFSRAEVVSFFDRQADLPLSRRTNGHHGAEANNAPDRRVLENPC